MRVALLGPLELYADHGQVIDLGGVRLRMLLARLALDAGTVVPFEVLVDGLWGTDTPANATGALHSLVSRVRRVLPGEVLRSRPAGYLLDVDREQVDALRFERTAVAGRAALRDGDPRAAAESLRAALALWRGPALAGLAEAPFAASAGARLGELRVDATEDRIDADLRLGRHRDVLAELNTLTAEHPLRERLAILQVTALYQAGRQAEALAAYERVRTALSDELGIDPSDQLREVHLAVLRADPKLAPAAAEPARSAGGRLPVRLTSFVGRDTELRAVMAELAASRLVTLHGPGGAGKTRLATEVASIDEPSWFVALASATTAQTADDLAAVVLGVLGVDEIRIMDAAPGRAPNPVDRLVEALAGQPCLLVLDNCEHVIGAAAELATALLAGCPQLRVLATSREPLAITGETTFPIGPLPDSDAARLFTDRARAARPGFAVDDTNGTAVAEICRRLDGMPLAIELAAARLRAMTVGQIAERLDDRFRLLTGGSRTSLPRHRTLRAVVEWSWELLTDEERALADRLSVFPAGATVEAAAQVCEGDVYLLASLAEKSLVDVVEGGDGQPRYRMLETVRAFAAQRLADAALTPQVRRAFAAYYLRLIEEIDPHLHGGDQLRGIARLRAERDNSAAAVRYAVELGDADLATRLCCADGWFAMLVGRTKAAGALSLRALALPGPTRPSTVATLRVFTMFGETGLPGRAEAAALLDGLTSTDAMADYPLLAMVEPILAMFAGDRAAAERAFQRGLNHADPWARAVATVGLAFRAENDGDIAASQRWAETALAQFQELGDRWGQALALSRISERLSTRGEHAAAIEAHEQAVRLVRELGAREELPMRLARLGQQRWRAGDLEGSHDDLLRALDAARETGTREPALTVLCTLATVARARGDLTASARYLSQAREACHQISRPAAQCVAQIECAQAMLDVARGELDAARSAAVTALRAVGAIPDMPMLSGIAETLAHLAGAADRPADAARFVGLGSALRGTPDVGNPELVALTENLTEALGEDGYGLAYGGGAALSKDGAAAALRAELGLPDPAPVGP